MTAFLVWGSGLCLVFVWMTIVWLFSQSQKNAGWVDPGWTLSIAGLNIYYLAAAGHADVKSIVLAAIVSLWGIRLTGHLLVRLVGERVIDPRYAAIYASWKNHQELRLFFLFQSQAVIAAILSIPFLLVHIDSRTEFGPWQKAALVLWLLGFFGEALADWQLRHFRSGSGNKGKVCQDGLWNYSRHPNYFFEWLMWAAYGIYAANAPGGWIGFASPALMLFFLLKVSGIPPAEEQSLKSRGDAYRAYQKSTSVFIPWFKRKAGS